MIQFPSSASPVLELQAWTNSAAKSEDFFKMTSVLVLISSRLLFFMLHVSCSLCIMMTILLVDDILWEMAYCVIMQIEHCLKVQLQGIQLWISKCAAHTSKLKCVFSFFKTEKKS